MALQIKVNELSPQSAQGWLKTKSNHRATKIFFQKVWYVTSILRYIKIT